YPLKELLKECRRHVAETGDRVTFEYVLLKDFTDQIEHARKMWDLVKNIPCKINIIPFNEHPGSGFERPSDEQVERFHSELIRLCAHVLLRRTMGRDILAACGQLTSEFAAKPKVKDISNSKIGARPRVRASSGRQRSTSLHRNTVSPGGPRSRPIGQLFFLGRQSPCPGSSGGSRRRRLRQLGHRASAIP